MQVAFVYLPNSVRSPGTCAGVPGALWIIDVGLQLLALKRKRWNGKENACYSGLFCIFDLGRLERLGQNPQLLWEIWVLGPGWCPVMPPGDSVSLVKLALAWLRKHRVMYDNGRETSFTPLLLYHPLPVDGQFSLPFVVIRVLAKGSKMMCPGSWSLHFLVILIVVGCVLQRCIVEGGRFVCWAGGSDLWAGTTPCAFSSR